MRATMLAAAVAVALALTSTASAASLTPASARTVAGEADVTTAAYGCGAGFVPNRFGFCRPIYRPYGFYGPRRFYGPRHGFYGPRPFYGPRRFYGQPFF